MPKENEIEWASMKEAFDEIKNEAITIRSFSTDKEKSILWFRFTRYLNQLSEGDQRLLIGSLWHYKKKNEIESAFIDLYFDL